MKQPNEMVVVQMVSFKFKGDIEKTKSFLNKLNSIDKSYVFDQYGQRGVELLKETTPVDTGLTRDSWYYEIERRKDKIILGFMNNNIQEGTNVAVVIYTGHATASGYWIEGRDYITPQMQELLDEIAEGLYREVMSE